MDCLFLEFSISHIQTLVDCGMDGKETEGQGGPLWILGLGC
jgi:hypothetical protein